MEVYHATTRGSRKLAQRPMAVFLTGVTFLLFLTCFALTIMATGLVGDTKLFRGSSVFGPGTLLLDPDNRPSRLTLLLPLAMAGYQFIWIVYTMTTLCQTSARVNSNYYIAPCLHICIFIPYLVALILLVAWLFTADRGRADVALFFDFAIVVALVTSVVYAIRGVESQGYDLYNAGLYHHVRLIRGLVTNGVAMAAAVFSMATIQSLGGVLYKYAGATEETADTIVLGITGVVLLVWVALDIFLLERYMRHLFAPYFVAVTSLARIVAMLYNPWDLNTILSFSILGFAALCTLAKLIVSCSRMIAYIDPILIRNNNTLLKNSVSRESNISKIHLGPSRTSQVYSSSNSIVPAYRAASTYSLPGSALPARLHSSSLLGSTHSAPMPGAPQGAPSTGGYTTYTYERPGSLYGGVTSPRYVVDAGDVTTARMSRPYIQGSLYR